MKPDFAIMWTKFSRKTQGDLLHFYHIFKHKKCKVWTSPTDVGVLLIILRLLAPSGPTASAWPMLAATAPTYLFHDHNPLTHLHGIVVLSGDPGIPLGPFLTWMITKVLLVLPGAGGTEKEKQFSCFNVLENQVVKSLGQQDLDLISPK